MEIFFENNTNICQMASRSSKALFLVLNWVISRKKKNRDKKKKTTVKIQWRKCYSKQSGEIFKMLCINLYNYTSHIVYNVKSTAIAKYQNLRFSIKPRIHSHSPVIPSQINRKTSSSMYTLG